MLIFEVSDIKSATKELGEKRHELKKERALEILKAARKIVRKRGNLKGLHFYLRDR
ncbi:MAG: hypothetical protein QXR17_04970 [Candidatus Bathyarchaeia archaeon]